VGDDVTLTLAGDDALADVLELAARQVRAGLVPRGSIVWEEGMSNVSLRQVRGAPPFKVHLPGVAREDDESWSEPTTPERKR